MRYPVAGRNEEPAEALRAVLTARLPHLARHASRRAMAAAVIPAAAGIRGLSRRATP